MTDAPAAQDAQEHKGISMHELLKSLSAPNEHTLPAMVIKRGRRRLHDKSSSSLSAPAKVPERELSSTMWSGGGKLENPDTGSHHYDGAGVRRAALGRGASSSFGSSSETAGGASAAASSDTRPPRPLRRLVLRVPLPSITLPVTMYAFSGDMRTRWLVEWQSHDPATRRDRFHILGCRVLSGAHEGELEGELEGGQAQAAEVRQPHRRQQDDAREKGEAVGNEAEKELTPRSKREDDAAQHVRSRRERRRDAAETTTEKTAEKTTAKEGAAGAGGAGVHQVPATGRIVHSLAEASILLFARDTDPFDRHSRFVPEWFWLSNHLPVHSSSPEWAESLSTDTITFVPAPVLLSAP